MLENVPLEKEGNSGDARTGRRKADSLARIKAAARRLFVTRGYHETRPQDIARDAGLGHGTFYLHYPDKRACFLAFVDDASRELEARITAARAPGQSLEERIGTTLNAIFEYSDLHPGVLTAAMTDECAIEPEDLHRVPLSVRWGREWAELVRARTAGGSYDADIIGQAIVGALRQCGREGSRGRLCRKALVDNLTRFLTRALQS
jgi:AcrR family transcriptional regulator